MHTHNLHILPREHAYMLTYILVHTRKNLYIRKTGSSGKSSDFYSACQNKICTDASMGNWTTIDYFESFLILFLITVIFLIWQPHFIGAIKIGQMFILRYLIGLVTYRIGADSLYFIYLLLPSICKILASS